MRPSRIGVCCALRRGVRIEASFLLTPSLHVKAARSPGFSSSHGARSRPVMHEVPCAQAHCDSGALRVLRLLHARLSPQGWECTLAGVGICERPRRAPGWLMSVCDVLMGGVALRRQLCLTRLYTGRSARQRGVMS